jgi:tRNA (guanine26-N2/guanine27-N2)-dimethyltransferase
VVKLPRKIVLVEEGLARLYVPDLSEYIREDGLVEPAWMPVFYNPSARLSRDITILALRAFFNDKKFFFVDLLAGTGVRGIRIALEAGGVGIVNDVDPRAFDFMVENIKLNKLESELTPFNMEANALGNLLTFTGVFVDYVDIDPYGSPIPYIESSLKPLGKKALIGVSATDKGPLACVNKDKTLKRYWLDCADVDFKSELGLRLLTYNIALRASAMNYTITPVLYLSKAHYYRVFYVAERKNPFDVISKCRGYIWYCPTTLERGFKYDRDKEFDCSDGNRPLLIGPLWICPIGDENFARRLLAVLEKTLFLQRREVLKYVEYAQKEFSVNEPFIRLDLLCRKIRADMPNMELLVERLEELGFNASRTHLDPRGLKTNAPLKIVESTILELSGK